ncbi:MAG: endonuclease domain-containing protein [Acidimicrobiaceae bacterium]|nr:endonuclease VII domain-containing protein [Acidimicrobiia bacterium]MCY4495580.1 endonuclease domain-containing protein [Acidimicrobiaceae bacterium]
MTEWVVITDTRQLAVVTTRSLKGVKVRFPKTGDEGVYPNEKVAAFDPTEYPAQISATEREKKVKAGLNHKPDSEKPCNKCLTLKPVSEFAANQTRKDGSTIYRPSCHDCRSGVDGVKMRAERKDGTKPDKPQIGDLWKCPVCLQIGIAGTTAKVVLDHDHLTGYAREYICDSCNTGLGRFRNGEDYLQSAVEYLQRWE